jgi:hypothetical protein
LAQLAAAGAPVLDVRRLLQLASEPRHHSHQPQQQQQQQRHQQCLASPLQQPAAAVTSTQQGSSAAAGGVQMRAGDAGVQHRTQAEAQATISCGCASSTYTALGGGSIAGSAGGSVAAGSSGSSTARGKSRRRNKHQLQAGDKGPAASAVDAAGACSQQLLQPGALAASQQLARAHEQWAVAAAAAAAALQQVLVQQQTGSSSSSTAELSLDDDATAEAVSALVQQLAKVVPQVQLIVLPVVLPGGRVGQRLPGGKGGGGSRLSAPRLLSLNVPFLVPMRHAWEQLHRLRQVLLMVGPPLPMATASQQQVSAGLGYRCDSSSDQESAVAAAGAGDGGATEQQLNMSQHLSAQQQQQQQQQNGSAGGGMVRGVFSLQQLEQQLQQQVHLGSSTPHGCLVQCKDWFDAELEQQQQQQPGGAMSGATNGTAHGAGRFWAPQGPQHAGGAAAGVTASSQAQQQQQQQQQLPGYALEAIQGMVLSCMDRQALQTSAGVQS